MIAAIGEMKRHKAAAANITAARIGDGLGIAHRNCGIHRIAACF